MNIEDLWLFAADRYYSLFLAHVSQTGKFNLFLIHSPLSKYVSVLIRINSGQNTEGRMIPKNFDACFVTMATYPAIENDSC
jgi:hypothetical protein